MLNRLKPTTTKPRAGDQNLLRNLNVSYIPCDVLEEELVHNNFYYYLSFQFLLRYSIHDKINFSRMFRNFFHNPHKSCDLIMTVTKNINLQKTLKMYTCLLIIFLHWSCMMYVTWRCSIASFTINFFENHKPNSNNFRLFLNVQINLILSLIFELNTPSSVLFDNQTVVLSTVVHFRFQHSISLRSAFDLFFDIRQIQNTFFIHTYLHICHIYFINWINVRPTLQFLFWMVITKWQVYYSRLVWNYFISSQFNMKYVY